MHKTNLIQIEKDLQQITDMLMLNGTLTECPGLVYAKMGIAIFFFHYAQYTQNDTIYDLLEKCLLDDDSIWFLTRSKTECKNCVFVDMCPPIGNYEKVFDTNMLCKCINLL